MHSIPQCRLARIVALLLLFGLAECAKGSCLSYGHSCWGAHGKRSSPVNNGARNPEDPIQVPIPAEDMKWFLTRFANGPSSLDRDNTLYRFEDVVEDQPQDAEYGQEEDDKDKTVVLFAPPREDISKRNSFRMYKLMDRAARKMDLP